MLPGRSTCLKAIMLVAVILQLLCDAAAVATVGHASIIGDPQRQHDGQLDQVALDAATQRFSKVLQFETVSDRNALFHTLREGEFTRLHTFLQHAYPEVWSTLSVHRVGGGNHSLLLRWEGSQSDLDPVLFISHLDVVPVANETLDQWEYPPFSGAIADGYVWGRGALDVKIGVVGLLEAVTLLIQHGWRPVRTVMLGFGQDEEVGGDQGAGQTADFLRSLGVTTLDVVVDEGSTVYVDGFAPYTTHPIALISTAEKGYYSLKVTVQGTGGHSSVPPIDHSSAAVAAGKLLLALDAQAPRPALVPPMTDFLQALAPLITDKPWLATLFAHPERPGYTDAILQHHLLVDSPLTAALAHTTVAVTGIQAYVGDNVLPPTASLNVNFRLLPGDTVDTVMEYVKTVVDKAGLTGVTYTPVRPDAPPASSEATPVTNCTGRHFAALKQALQDVWPKGPGGEPVAVAPFLMSGGTDSRHYLDMSSGGVLRFQPTSTNVTAGDSHRVHGVNERLRVVDLGRAILVYRRAIELLAGA